MNGKFSNDDSEYSPENSGGDSPGSTGSGDAKIASTSSSRRSRRGLKKRVVSFPMREAEGIRVKGGQMKSPPSDSWAWRKYGQKPIKDSPYPRGYYRCSSSKVCPARKQVQRSKTDPRMIIVTYSCEHNHPSPPRPRNNHHQSTSAAVTAKSTASSTPPSSSSEEDEEEENKSTDLLQSKQSGEDAADYKLANISEGPPIEFDWFPDFEPTNCCTMLEDTIYEEGITIESEMAGSFAMREEDEPLFADLEVLPECSTVFRRGMAGREMDQRRHCLATTRT